MIGLVLTFIHDFTNLRSSSNVHFEAVSHPHCSWDDFLLEEEEYFRAGLVGATLHKQSLGRFEVVENMHFVVVEDTEDNMHFVMVEGKKVVDTANSGEN